MAAADVYLACSRLASGAVTRETMRRVLRMHDATIGNAKIDRCSEQARKVQDIPELPISIVGLLYSLRPCSVRSINAVEYNTRDKRLVSRGHEV